MIKHLLKPLALAAGITLGVAACGKHADQSAKAPAAAASAKTAMKPAAASTAPLFNVALLDTSTSACQNLDNFVNEKWRQANPIPADRVRWGAIRMMAERNLKEQRQIAEQAAKHADSAKPGSIEQKVGWMYASAMDMTARDKAGVAPIKPLLASIDAIRSRRQLQPWLDVDFAKGEGMVFAFGSMPDFHDARMQIASADQDGLNLPSTDYYSQPQYKDIRKAYVAYLTKLFRLTGDTAAKARQQAVLAMKFETALAKHSIPNVQMRDPKNQYHFVTVAEADKVTPHFDWNSFFKAQGVDVGKGFSLSQPTFFAAFDHMLATTPLAEWRAYLKAHTLTHYASDLSQPFVDAYFDFNGKTLNGQPKQKPQWKLALGAVNNNLGMAMGQLYVAKYFPPEAKARIEKQIGNELLALKHRIENLEWMTPATKQKALDKLAKVVANVGYPDHWRSWKGLEISKNDFFANVRAAQKFNNDYDLAKIGKPTDRHEWHMTPQTINAYYSSSTNTINFPAAILQPPLFYIHGDDALNYGGIGSVIGHEVSHGFDDKGSLFDGNGNLNNWWTKADRTAYDARTKKLVAQFDGYYPYPKDHPKVHVNGKLTLGENIADLGGLNIAYDALQMALKNHPKEASEKINGYTEDQRFFLAFARNWRRNTREKALLVQMASDPHSPPQYRAIGAPSNMPAFAKAFQCKPGDPMVRPADKRVKIW